MDKNRVVANSSLIVPLIAQARQKVFALTLDCGSELYHKVGDNNIYMYQADYQQITYFRDKAACRKLRKYGKKIT